MRNGNKVTILGLALVVALTAPALGTANDADVVECAVPVEPRQIEMRSEPYKIAISLAVPAGVLPSIEAEIQSGLRVLEVESSEAGRLVFRVDSSQARVGRWWLTFEWEGERCATRITIENSSPPTR